MSEDRPKRQPPDVPALLGVLGDASVGYVVTGSAAAMLHGVPLVPGDLDITPALDVENLMRLAVVLESIEARQDPLARSDIGSAETTVSGTGSRPSPHPSRRSPSELDTGPRPPASFDHLLQSRHGALDVVPVMSGTYDDLIARAVPLDIQAHRVWVESVDDLLATLTVPRRAKDQDRVARLRAIQRSASRTSTPGGGS